MKPEPSKLARLVVAYYEKFGHHVPEAALRQVDARDLAAMLEKSLAAGVPIAETKSGSVWPWEFSPRGCIRDGGEEHVTPTKGPDGERLQ